MQLVNARTVIYLQNKQGNEVDKPIVIPGDTTKYIVLYPNEQNSRRVYVDATTTAQSLSSIYDCCNAGKAIDHAVIGGSSVILTVSVGSEGINERKKYTKQIIQEIEQHVVGTENLTVTFLYAALTDFNIIDLYKNQSVPNEKIKALVDLHSVCDDWSELQKLLDKGTTMPFILSIRFEYDGDTSGPGELNIIDLGCPLWGTSLHNSSIADAPIEKSITELGKLIAYITSDKVATEAEFASYPLIKLIGSIFSSNAMIQSCFFLAVDNSLENQIIRSLNLAENIRKIRTVPAIFSTDRRVAFLKNSLKISLSQKFQLSKENAILQEKINTIEKDLDELQHAWADEKHAIEDEIGDLQKQKAELQSQFDLAKSEQEDLKSQHKLELEKKNTEKLLVSDTIDKLNIEIAKNERKISDLSDTIVQIKEAYETSINKQREMANYLRVSEERNDELTKKLNESMLLLDKGGDYISSLVKNTITLKPQLDNKNSELSKLSSAIASIENERDSLKMLVSELSGRLKESEISYSSTLKSLKLSNEEFNSLKKAESEEISKLKEAIKKSEESSAENQHLVEELEDSKSELQNQVDTLKRELKNVNKILRNERDRLNDLMDQSNDKQELSFEREQWKRDKEGLQRQINSLKSFLDQAIVREDELRLYNEDVLNQLNAEKATTHKLILKLQKKPTNSNAVYADEESSGGLFNDITTTSRLVPQKKKDIVAIAKLPPNKNMANDVDVADDRNIVFGAYTSPRRSSEVVISSPAEAIQRIQESAKISTRGSALSKADEIYESPGKGSVGEKSITDEVYKPAQAAKAPERRGRKKGSAKNAQENIKKPKPSEIVLENFPESETDFVSDGGSSDAESVGTRNVSSITQKGTVIGKKNTKAPTNGSKKTTIKSKGKPRNPDAQVNKEERVQEPTSANTSVGNPDGAIRSRRQCAANVSYKQSPLASLKPTAQKPLPKLTRPAKDSGYSSSASTEPDTTIALVNIPKPKPTRAANKPGAKRQTNSKISQMAERIRSKASSRLIEPNSDEDSDSLLISNPKSKKRKISIGKTTSSITISSKLTDSETEINPLPKTHSFSLYGFKLPPLKLPNLK